MRSAKYESRTNRVARIDRELAATRPVRHSFDLGDEGGMAVGRSRFYYPAQKFAVDD